MFLLDRIAKEARFSSIVTAASWRQNEQGIEKQTATIAKKGGKDKGKDITSDKPKWFEELCKLHEPHMSTATKKLIPRREAKPITTMSQKGLSNIISEQKW